LNALERGRLIAFEGGEGAGKSTQIRRLAATLVAAGLDVVQTREPGGTPGAEAIRALVTEGAAERWSPLAETLLFFAARQDHVERLIRPALAKGRWVLTDRFMDSTRVYQGVAGALGLERIDALHRAVFGGLAPDLTVLLDVPVESGLKRRRGGGEINRFDAMAVDFHEKVRRGFLDLAAMEPERFGVIDATPSEDEVAKAVAALVSRRFPAALRMEA
jgi:dTMP kinase